MIKSVQLKAGTTHTVETFWNATAVGFFRAPAGSKINVKYGKGRLSINRQTQTLDGTTYKKLTVGKGSLVVARMRVKVAEDSIVDYSIMPGGVAQQFPQERF